MGNKILIIRVFALISVVVGIYAIFWFLFSRISQTTETTYYSSETEINAPRLNKKEVSDLITLIEDRRIYDGSEQVEGNFEGNPFQ